VERPQAEREKARAFYERQEKRNAEKRRGFTRRCRRAKYTGKSTYFDQIVTSLKTVSRVLIATLVAVPLGILCDSA